MKVILKIDTTIPKKVIVELNSPNLNKKIEKDQVLGSQVLLPAIDEILNKNKLKIQDVTAVEVNPGPGSFTGTRVGVAVANALGLVLSIPVNGKKGKIVEPIYDKSKFDIKK